MPTPCWLKHLCSIRAWVPVSFFLSILSVFLFLSIYFWLIPWSAEARWAHFLARASKTLSRRHTAPSPTGEGAWCLCAAARALRTGLYWLSASTRGFQPLCLSYFLIVDSGPPGSGPFKDQQWTYVGKVMSLLFKTLSRFDIAILPRSKRFLNFVIAVTVHIDFGAQESEIWHCFHVFLIYLPWSDRTTCQDLSFLNVEFLSQLFYSPLSLSSRDSLVPLHFLLLKWCHLHILGCWYFSW